MWVFNGGRGRKINHSYQKSSRKSGHKQHRFAVGVKQNSGAGRELGSIIRRHLTKPIPELGGFTQPPFC